MILKEVDQPIIRSLHAINRVVLKGLKPLEEAVKKDQLSIVGVKSL